ncbi:MAG: hypothetical protein JW915_20725 [Chitinispirillaceae bacterium]|nr:hypothetical protein [Chitinispirillaceae bacterium]
MALLILNEDEACAAGKTPEAEKFYEFDPNDRTAINRIHTILSLRKKSSAEKSEKVLAEVCTKSLEQSFSKTSQVHVSSWFQTISGYIPKFNTINGNYRKPKKIYSSGHINIRFPSI